jgi:hypothetical protein
MQINLILILLIIIICLIITKNSINIEHFYVIAEEESSKPEDMYVLNLKNESCSDNVNNIINNILNRISENKEIIQNYYSNKKQFFKDLTNIKIDFNNNNKCQSLIKIKPLLEEQNKQIQNEIDEIYDVIGKLKELHINYIGDDITIKNPVLTKLDSLLHIIEEDTKENINYEIGNKINSIKKIINDLAHNSKTIGDNYIKFISNITKIKENLLDNKSKFNDTINYINSNDSPFQTLKLYDNKLSDKITDSYMGSNIKEVCLEDGPNSNDICKNYDWGCKISCEFLNKNEDGDQICNSGNGIDYDIYTNIFGEQLKVHSHIHVHPGPHPHPVPNLQENNEESSSSETAIPIDTQPIYDGPVETGIPIDSQPIYDGPVQEVLPSPPLAPK